MHMICALGTAYSQKNSENVFGLGKVGSNFNVAARLGFVVSDFSNELSSKYFLYSGANKHLDFISTSFIKSNLPFEHRYF